MKIGTSLRKRITVCAAMLCLLAPMAHARRTVREKKQLALVQFETAERLRGTLARKSESRRTRADYEKVMEAYRKVYHTAPNSIRADTAILTVAELLDEEGRLFHDNKSYSDAIGQLVFLRREYPGSKYRVAALFTIGEIYRDDLKDPVQAKATFEDYVKYYPHSSLAPDAHAELKEIAEAESRDPFKRKNARPIPDVTAKAAWVELAPPRQARDSDSEQAAAADKDASPASSKGPRENSANTQTGSGKAAASGKDSTTAVAEADSDAAGPPTAPQPLETALDKTATLQQPVKRTAHMTGIRHWSTPDYTRVAIDLETEVEYQAGRVPRPDRIFFDLYNTKLSGELIGKSFDVGSGFLHRIRLSQYKANMARVVLDVDDVAEYSAFLLPNPYRLIIDIHGKLPAQQVATAEHKSAAGLGAKDKDSTSETNTGETLIAGKTAPALVKASESVPAESDVTVTHLAPVPESKSQDSALAKAIDHAEKTPAGPLKKREAKHHEATSRATKNEDGSAGDKTGAAGEEGVQVASAVAPKKIVSDDTAIDESAPVTGKPTTGPTFQTVAPQAPAHLTKKASPGRPSTAVASSRVAAPTASGDRSLIRALGLKIGKIVIDAGHGGHDTGTIGPNGLMEKDLVLDVALKLGKMLESKLGAEVVYTRDDDTFIPLETRTAVANKEQADLFISIHANSSSDSSARGVETYYLNFTSSRDALEVAARENSVSEKSIHELQDLVKKIALKEKIEESRELATDVQKSLYTGLSTKSPAIHNRGVKKAPFIVLIGANMPSILAEISFVSNPTDERKLKSSEYRQRVADALYKGIHRYINSLSGVRVAAKAEGASNNRSGAAALAAK